MRIFGLQFGEKAPRVCGERTYHDFEPRYDTTVTREENGWVVTTTAYIRDICIGCGQTVDRRADTKGERVTSADGVQP